MEGVVVVVCCCCWLVSAAAVASAVDAIADEALLTACCGVGRVTLVAVMPTPPVAESPCGGVVGGVMNVMGAMLLACVGVAAAIVACRVSRVGCVSEKCSFSDRFGGASTGNIARRLEGVGASDACLSASRVCAIVCCAALLCRAALLVVVASSEIGRAAAASASGSRGGGRGDAASS